MNTTTSPAPFRLVCKIDADGLYAGPVPAYLSPLDQTWPLPANSIAIDPPAGELPAHHTWQLNARGDGWTVIPDCRSITAYDTATGQPLPAPGLGECLPANATLHVPPVAGAGQVRHWNAGLEQWQLLPDHRGESYWLADGSHHVINEAGDMPPEGSFTEPPPPTIDQLRLSARDSINIWRDEQERCRLEHAGQVWDTDEAAMTRLDTVLLSGRNPLEIWTSADNTDVPMSFGDMQDLFAAIVERNSGIHARQREMKRQVERMDRAQLEAFRPDWPAPARA